MSFRYDALADPRDRRQTGADLVLAGTVRKQKDELRIGVEVTDVRTGIQVWPERQIVVRPGAPGQCPADPPLRSQGIYPALVQGASQGNASSSVTADAGTPGSLR